MAAGPITVFNRPATIESDATKRVITVQAPRASLVCIGPSNVFLGFLFAVGDLARDGAQRDGEVEMEPGDSFPLPDGTSKVEHQCLAAQTSKLQYIPLRT